MVVRNLAKVFLAQIICDYYISSLFGHNSACLCMSLKITFNQNASKCSESRVIPSAARVLLAKLGYMVEWEPECEKKKAIQPSNRPTIKDTLPSAVIPPIFVFFF